MMWTVMTMVVKLTEQKGPEETEGSSEVTGPVQQGEVRGGFFKVFFAYFLITICSTFYCKKMNFDKKSSKIIKMSSLDPQNISTYYG